MQRLVHHSLPADSGTSLISNPSVWGSSMIVTGDKSVDIYSQFHNGSCLLIWMSDHFKDGWDIAVLTVFAPDKTNDTFHPHCNQVDPFKVRYCPYQVEDTGVYIVKVFAPTRARFFWELNYEVTIENNGAKYKGDFSTKMRFQWNPTKMQFDFYDIENPVDMHKYLIGDCHRCTHLSQKGWRESGVPGSTSFFPLLVRNAPYYISDNEGRSVVHSGMVSQIRLASCSV